MHIGYEKPDAYEVPIRHAARAYENHDVRKKPISSVCFDCDHESHKLFK